MSPPEIAAFSFNSAAGAWICSFKALDCSLSIQDENGEPSQKGYALLVKAMSDFESIALSAHRHILGFCSAKSVDEDGPGGFVELAVKNWRETTALSVYFFYEIDPYNLWSVDFTWDQYNKWAPVAFRREDW